MLKLHDVVKLKKGREDLGISSSDLGSVVDILQGGEAYIVEFIDDDGETIEDSLFTEFTESELVLEETGF